MKEATPLRHFLKEATLMPCVFKTEQKESFHKNARVSFAFCFSFNCQKSKTFEDSFTDHQSHVRVVVVVLEYYLQTRFSTTTTTTTTTNNNNNDE